MLPISPLTFLPSPLPLPTSAGNLSPFLYFAPCRAVPLPQCRIPIPLYCMKEERKKTWKRAGAGYYGLIMVLHCLFWFQYSFPLAIMVWLCCFFVFFLPWLVWYKYRFMMAAPWLLRVYYGLNMAHLILTMGLPCLLWLICCFIMAVLVWLWFYYGFFGLRIVLPWF